MDIVRYVMFHGEMHDNIIMRKDKKKFCAAARSFWPEARFWDFFGLKKAVFLSFQMMKNVVHDL